ncbi:hypothetical protein ACFQV2_39140 [Actinokineospora soli]|uniref:TetR family transcriptional regulator n=1 Tax=Actinokineospora soli TaxID=1048753 RepID=A0ABW2TXF4_9PSEU
MTTLSRESVRLRAMLRRDSAELRRLDTAADSGETDFVRLGRLAVRLFATLVTNHFRPETSLAELSAFAVWVRQTFGPTLGVSAIVVEMVIRRELGESVPIDDLSDDLELTVMLSVSSLLVHRGGLLDAELEELLLDMERADAISQQGS